jgi:hypothetical protein
MGVVNCPLSVYGGLGKVLASLDPLFLFYPIMGK